MRRFPTLPSVRPYEDAIAGIGLILFAIFALWTARSYPVGATSNMGPGFFPRAMAALIAGLGALLAVNNLRRPLAPTDLDEALRPRPLLAVAASYVAFALALKPLGLLPATLALIVISGFAVRRRGPVEWMLIVVLLEAMTYLLWYLVNISVPLVGGN